MRNRFQEMSCYVLAGGISNSGEDLQCDGELTRLERSYRRYAAVFEKVTLVLKREQAREHYLNYPHVCDDTAGQGAVFGIEAALRQADSDAVFIGSSELTEFPLELLVELVKSYQGEAFLGYQDGRSGAQPLFGIYSKQWAAKWRDTGIRDTETLMQVLSRDGRLLPLPEPSPVEQVNRG